MSLAQSGMWGTRPQNRQENLFGARFGDFLRMFLPRGIGTSANELFASQARNMAGQGVGVPQSRPGTPPQTAPPYGGPAAGFNVDPDDRPYRPTPPFQSPNTTPAGLPLASSFANGMPHGWKVGDPLPTPQRRTTYWLPQGPNSVWNTEQRNAAQAANPGMTFAQPDPNQRVMGWRGSQPVYRTRG